MSLTHDRLITVQQIGKVCVSESESAVIRAHPAQGGTMDSPDTTRLLMNLVLLGFLLLIVSVVMLVLTIPKWGSHWLAEAAVALVGILIGRIRRRRRHRTQTSRRGNRQNEPPSSPARTRRERGGTEVIRDPHDTHRRPAWDDEDTNPPVRRRNGTAHTGMHPATWWLIGLMAALVTFGLGLAVNAAGYGIGLFHRSQRPSYLFVEVGLAVCVFLIFGLIGMTIAARQENDRRVRALTDLDPHVLDDLVRLAETLPNREELSRIVRTLDSLRGIDPAELVTRDALRESDRRLERSILRKADVAHTHDDAPPTPPLFGPPTTP